MSDPEPSKTTQASHEEDAATFDPNTINTTKLPAPFTLSYFKKAQNRSYEENTIKLGTVSTVEEFWLLYVHLRRPIDERPSSCDYHLFREGIKPMWEDEANINGGKWIVRLKKGLAARYWEDVLLAILGGAFTGVDDNEICGAVLSVRYQEDILSVWNRSADSRRVCLTIRDTLREVMELPATANMEYKKHTDSMRDNSSYRNTQSHYPGTGDKTDVDSAKGDAAKAEAK